MTQKSLTILLADDDPDDQMLIADAFTAIDTTLYLNVVGDGHAVLDYLQKLSSEQFPCLIVLDYNMPGLNGLEVLRLLRGDSRYKNIPKVILSTTDNPQFVKECMNNGADKYLIKPVSYQSLVGIARELMEWCTAGIQAK
jgi:CheY-like chemotaxis protein